MQLCFHGRGGFSWIDTYLYMPSIYRKLYIRLINEELKREEENRKETESDLNEDPKSVDEL